MKFSFFLLTLICSLFFSNCHSQAVITDEQAMRELQHFYISYIKEVSASSLNTRRFDSLLLRYSTPTLTEQLKGQAEAGGDFILNSNFPQVESASTVKVYKDIKEKDIYVVSYIFYGSNDIVKIKIKLIKTNTGILIDKVIM